VSDEQIPTGPITAEELANWKQSLTPEDRAELRRRQLERAAIDSAKTDEEPNWGAMSEQEWLRERMRRYGY
jgi:hypothetical protein